MIETSYAAVLVIPKHIRKTLLKMYEDNELEKAEEIEDWFDFIDEQVPETLVLIFANNSVTPPCVHDPEKDFYEHYYCDFYDPWWYYVLVAKDEYDGYKEAMDAAHMDWIREHDCQVLEREGV